MAPETGPHDDWVLLSDNDGHDYLVPLRLTLAFSSWVEAMESGDDWDGHDYDDNRLNMSPSQYCFTGTWQERDKIGATSG